jgi:hypothetical protein
LGLAREYLWDDATAEELREEIMRHLCVLVNGGVRDLSAFFGAEAHSEYNVNQCHATRYRISAK